MSRRTGSSAFADDDGEDSPDLLYRGDDACNVLRPRQAMIAVLDHGQHDVVGWQPMRQRQGMLPGHIPVLGALQDAHRATDIDRAAQQQMVAALLDQGACDRIGRTVAIFRWPQPNAPRLDLLANL